MSQRHWLSLETQNGKTVYRSQIFGNNIFADEEFYNNLHLDIDWEDGRLKKTEVDFRELFIEWHDYIGRTIDFQDYVREVGKDFVGMGKKATLFDFAMERNSIIGQFYHTFWTLLKYTDETSVEKLNEKYKLYLSIY